MCVNIIRCGGYFNYIKLLLNLEYKINYLYILNF